jgi:hypothetical protein
MPVFTPVKHGWKGACDKWQSLPGEDFSLKTMREIELFSTSGNRFQTALS